MIFKIGDTVMYKKEKYVVINLYDSYIQIHSKSPGAHHGVTIPMTNEDYNDITLVLSEILKKL